jgi:hypothetical protein
MAYRSPLEFNPGEVGVRVKSVCVAFAMLVASSTAYAQQGTMGGSGAVLTDAPTADNEEANARAAQEAEQSGERLICRRIANTQSRMARRQVCLTARQWRERQ